PVPSANASAILTGIVPSSTRVNGTTMPHITVNEESRSFSGPLSVADLLRQLGRDPRQVAVEVNLAVIRRDDHARHTLTDGDRVEIVTLVGGGSDELAPHEVRFGETEPTQRLDKLLKVGKFQFRSRLFTGTGKYATYDLMRDCLAASGCE